METNASLDGDNSLCVIFIISKKERENFTMKLEIVRIENRIVTCAIEDTGSLLDIARCYFPDKIEEGKIIDIDVSKIKNNEVC